MSPLSEREYMRREDRPEKAAWGRAAVRGCGAFVGLCACSLVCWVAVVLLVGLGPLGWVGLALSVGYLVGALR